MKKKSICFVAALSIISSAAVFAANDDGSLGKSEGTNVANVKKEVGIKKATNSERVAIEELQKKLISLESQIAEMKKQQVVPVKAKHSGYVKKYQVASESVAAQKEVAQTQNAASGESVLDKLYGYGPAVATTPIIGTPDFAGWDLYINMPSVNEDLELNKRRQQLYNYYSKNGITPPERPTVALSGSLEGKIYDQGDYKGGSVSDITLSTVALEAVVNVNEWVSGLVKLTYSDLPPSDHDIRANTGDIYVDRAYMTFGNLDKFPLYASIGQMKVPFEMDTSYTISSTTTSNLGKMVERPVVLGFSAQGFYGSLYAFKGDTHEGSANNSINNWGGMFGYKGQLGSVEKLMVDVGAGAIRNLADALGLQDNGNSKTGEFQGFKQVNGADSDFSSKQIDSQVAAATAHAFVHYAPFDFVAEYVGAVQSFDEQDMTFNGSAAKPQALDVEAVYNFKVFDKPSSVGVAVDRTWQALAANLPKYSYFVFANTSMFKRTVQSIEWRHDVNYDSSDSATGQLNPVTIDGKNRDSFIGSFKIYF